MLKNIFQFTLSHSIFISVCAVAMVLQTFMVLHIPVYTPLWSFVFFATICSYNFYWLLSIIFSKEKFLLKDILGEPVYLLMILVGLTGIIFNAYYLKGSRVHIFISLLLTIIYAMPLLRLKGLSFARHIGFVKTLLLAFTWMFVTGFIPIQKSIRQLEYSEYLFLLNRFIFILILCIIFDNRNVSVDKIKGLYSLSTHFTPPQVRLLICMLFVMWVFVNYLFGVSTAQLNFLAALDITAFFTLAVYLFSLKKPGYFFYYFFVDGLMILSFILTSLASI